MIFVEYIRSFVTSLNAIAGLFAIIAAIPALISLYVWLRNSWWLLSKKEKELLEKMHNGNGEIRCGRGSCDHNGEKKSIKKLHANGQPLYKPKGEASYQVYRDYEEALAKLKNKGYIESGRSGTGEDFYTLTPKGTMTKRYF